MFIFSPVHSNSRRPAGREAIDKAPVNRYALEWFLHALCATAVYSVLVYIMCLLKVVSRWKS